MEDLIILDTSTLIEYFRKKKKTDTLLFKISGISNTLYISTITHFEILNGINPLQEYFWSYFFSTVIIVPYISTINYTAVRILQQLRSKRITIEFKDLVIAATAAKNNFRLAILNKKHFENIADLDLITPDSFK